MQASAPRAACAPDKGSSCLFDSAMRADDIVRAIFVAEHGTPYAAATAELWVPQDRENVV
jgi:hypothetical protein